MLGYVARSLAKRPSFMNTQAVRLASKKSSGNTKTGTSRGGRPHHYGWKAQDGHMVPAGSILVKQRTLRYHPGENVSVGETGDLKALESGTVVVTCEPFTIDLEGGHRWVQRQYADRPSGRVIYKKYFHVLTPPQHGRFRLVGEV